MVQIKCKDHRRRAVENQPKHFPVLPKALLDEFELVDICSRKKPFINFMFNVLGRDRPQMPPPIHPIGPTKP